MDTSPFQGFRFRADHFPAFHAGLWVHRPFGAEGFAPSFPHPENGKEALKHFQNFSVQYI